MPAVRVPRVVPRPTRKGGIVVVAVFSLRITVVWRVGSLEELVVAVERVVRVEVVAEERVWASSD